jgi:gluconokinase
MGVAGCGKTKLGRQLAQTLNLPFIEGDRFHSDSNIQKMKTGIALTDEDRASWLQAIIDASLSGSQGAVIACSALKQRYRDVFRQQLSNLTFLYLEIDEGTALHRVTSRPDHFYPPSLVNSQFEVLEVPSQEQDVLALDATEPVVSLIARAKAWLRGATSAVLA